ncbi:unnamed protein product [Toxocara canis]|uniref:Beta-1,4-glucuronyltransferase 1 n=1 Tax=Toxocara canis TaxID=6265 RepID=A0A183UAP9_TOXCA|nr:unnamed protein product [Toxocara canis]
MEVFERITLVVHVSANYLDNRIAEQVDAWEGPVTLSIVVPSVDVYANIHKIQHKACLVNLFSELSNPKETMMLLQLPKAVLDKLSAHIVFRSKKGCAMEVIASLNDQTTVGIYPVNVARNTARLLVRSKYILLGDYEFIFSRGFESRMRNLANDELIRNPKTALVFRIFEVNDTVQRLPRDKADLRKLFFQGMAVEFHAKFTSAAHKIPRLIDWFNHPVDKSKASLSNVLPLARRDWEPQFVSLNTIPFHDENFPFSLRDNTVLRWEMCRHNYTFVLVNDVFMVHRGIKTLKDAPETKKRQHRSRLQFKTAIKLFKDRMDKHFPETKQKCPEFGA